MDINRGFYEGGKRTGTNQDFWNANTDFENTASPDRDTMRARARWLHENNAIMANIDATIVRNSVGNGFTFQSKTGKENIDKQIEALWAEFIKPINCDVTRRQHFGDMQSLILSQRMCDGEIVIKKHLTGKKNNPFQIQLIEADRFDVSYKVRVDNSNVLSSVDGIELNTLGAPQNYVFREGLMSSVKVPASEVIHYFRMDNRATQYRGLSEYKQAIVDLRNFAGYQTSTLKSARARASVAYAIETTNVGGHIGALTGNKPEENDPIYDINGVMVHYLNKGEVMHQFDPTIKGTEYGEFVRSCVRLIAVARKVSYELAFRDYSQVNFSSARASFIQDHKRFSNEQWHLVTYVLNPLFEDWLDANVMAGNIKGLGVTAYFLNKSDFCQPRWIAPAREWVDPLKDINAIQKEYDMGLTNLSDIAASRGKVLEDVINDRIKENEMLKKAGILTKEEANA
jgi:lambda family phage portal protein